jgi:hypothetical protein
MHKTKQNKRKQKFLFNQMERNKNSRDKKFMSSILRDLIFARAARFILVKHTKMGKYNK